MSRIHSRGNKSCQFDQIESNRQHFQPTLHRPGTLYFLSLVQIDFRYGDATQGETIRVDSIKEGSRLHVYFWLVESQIPKTNQLQLGVLDNPPSDTYTQMMALFLQVSLVPCYTFVVIISLVLKSVCRCSATIKTTCTLKKKNAVAKNTI